MRKDLWAIVGVGAVLLGVVLATWWSSRTDDRAARAEIKEDINRVEDNLKADIIRVEDNINRVEDNLKADIIRVEDNINRVHGDLRILLEHALRGQSDGSARSPENAQD